MGIKIEECDKLPTTLCQPCVSKVEDMQNFYNQCQDAQKMLAVQYGVAIAEEENVDQHTVAIASNQGSLANLMVKEDAVAVLPVCTSTLSADKLLETAIKDTCILSGEDSEESSDATDGISEEDELSAGDDDDDEKVFIRVKLILIGLYELT